MDRWKRRFDPETDCAVVARENKYTKAPAGTSKCSTEIQAQAATPSDNDHGRRGHTGRGPNEKAGLGLRMITLLQLSQISTRPDDLYQNSLNFVWSMLPLSSVLVQPKFLT